MALTSDPVVSKIQYNNGSINLYIETSYIFILPTFSQQGCEVQIALYNTREDYLESKLPSYTINLGTTDIFISDNELSEKLHTFVLTYLNEKSPDTWSVTSLK